jgi:hypothetical protein
MEIARAWREYLSAWKDYRFVMDRGREIDCERVRLKAIADRGVASSGRNNRASRVFGSPRD